MAPLAPEPGNPRTCLLCGAWIIMPCGHCGSLSTAADYRRVGLRLSTLQHLAAGFCAACVSKIGPTTYDTILGNLRRSFEHTWAAQSIPEPLREQERRTMATWRILGFAQEIPGIEHGVPAPDVEAG